MKIIYLSDFNCPYSYIGLNRITNACNELGLPQKFSFTFTKAFKTSGSTGVVALLSK